MLGLSGFVSSGDFPPIMSEPERLVDYSRDLPVVHVHTIGAQDEPARARVEFFATPPTAINMEWRECSSKAPPGMHTVGRVLGMVPGGVPWQGRLIFWHGQASGHRGGVLGARLDDCMFKQDDGVMWCEGSYMCVENFEDRIVWTRIKDSDEVRAALPWIEKHRPANWADQSKVDEAEWSASTCSVS
jgi:hypothetical protein